MVAKVNLKHSRANKMQRQTGCYTVYVPAPANLFWPEGALLPVFVATIELGHDKLVLDFLDDVSFFALPMSLFIACFGAY